MLGPLVVRLSSGVDVPVGGPIRRALLARLVIDVGRVVSTDRLIDDLWQGEPPPTAATALRVQVTRLRRVLAATARDERQVLVHRPPGYALELAAEEVDVHRFEADLGRALDRAEAGDLAAASTGLEQALSWWRGDPFADLGDWLFLLPEIGRLHELHLLALEERASVGLARGRPAEVLPQLQQLVTRHPLRERLCGLVVIALYRCGRQAEALRVYGRSRRALGEELGIVPSLELQALEEAVLLQKAELDWQGPRHDDLARRLLRTVAEPPAGRRAGRPERGASDLGWAQAGPGLGFVGRGDAIRRLNAVRRSAGDGHRHLVLVEGEPGIGKTRMVGQAAAAADGEGTLVLFGRCDEEMTLPYQPFVEALTRVLGTDAVERDVPPALARLVPTLDSGVERRPDRLPADPEAERHRLFEAVDALLATLAGVQPVLLVVDDLQWADRPTLLLLRHLARSSRPASLTVVATCRSTDLDPSSALSGLIADVRRWPGLDEVLLEGLDVDEVGDLVASAGHPMPAIDVATRLRDETAGNPLFVTELIRHQIESAVGAVPPAHPSGVAATVVAEVPRGVREVVGRRLARLSPDTQRALSLAAVIGPEFPASVLGEVAELDEGDLLDALEEAIAARLVDEVAGGGDWHVFSHAIVRSTLYSQMSGARRARAHRRTAKAFEADPSRLGRGGTGQLAHHFCRGLAAGDADRALAYARQAASEAVEALAYEAAARHLGCALEALGRTGPDDELRCSLLLDQGDAYNRAGQDELAKPIFLEAAELARAAARSDLVAAAALGYGGAAATLPIATGMDDSTAVELFEAALAGLVERQEAGQDALRARVEGSLARHLYRSPDVERRAALARSAVATARRLDDPVALGTALADRFYALWGPADGVARVRIAEEIVALGERAGDRQLVLQGAQCQFHALLETGSFPEAEAAGRHRTALAEELRSPDGVYSALVAEAMYATIEGRFDEADRLAKRARAAKTPSSSAHAERIFAVQRYIIRWLQGRLGELRPRQEQLVASAPRWTTAASAVLLLIDAEDGRLPEAAAALGRLTASALGDVGRDYDWWASIMALSTACDRLGDTERAAMVREEVLPFAGRNCMLGQTAFLGAASHHLGVLAGVLGQWDEALGFFDRALERHRSMGARPYEALTQEAAARALLGRGRPGDVAMAGELAGAAFATASELGMATVVERASLVLNRGSGRGAPPASGRRRGGRPPR